VVVVATQAGFLAAPASSRAPLACVSPPKETPQSIIKGSAGISNIKHVSLEAQPSYSSKVSIADRHTAEKMKRA